MFPSEIINHIASFLPIHNQFRISRVNRDWYSSIISNIEDEYDYVHWNVGVFHTDTHLYNVFVCLGKPYLEENSRRERVKLCDKYRPLSYYTDRGVVPGEDLQLTIIPGEDLSTIGMVLSEFTQRFCKTKAKYYVVPSDSTTQYEFRITPSCRTWEHSHDNTYTLIPRDSLYSTYYTEGLLDEEEYYSSGAELSDDD